MDKAAVLVVRLAKNPLPDGSKRAAWVTLRVFIETNGWTWTTPPTVDDAEHAVLAIASGEWDETTMSTTMSDWLRAQLNAPS